MTENEQEQELENIVETKRGRGRPKKYNKLESTPELKTPCVGCGSWETTTVKTFGAIRQRYYDQIKGREYLFLRVRHRRCNKCHKVFKTFEGLDECDLEK